MKNIKRYKIGSILKKLGAANYEIIGNPNMEFMFPSTIWEGKRGSIAFCSKKKVSDTVIAICESKASVILAEKSVDTEKLIFKNKTIVLVDSPRKLFIKILNTFIPPEMKRKKIHASALVDVETNIHPSIYIGPHCCIGKCEIGMNTVIHPNVVVNDGVTIGKNVVIGPGCVIGYDGFGYSRDKDGHLEKFPHYGSVTIEDAVEIGSNVSIDRGTLSNTLIKKGAKIDNFCHIAHNVIVGRYTLVIAHAMIGGSTEVGDYSWVAPNVALREGIKVGSNVLIGLGAVVTKNVPDGMVVVGNPAIPFELFKKNQKTLKKLMNFSTPEAERDYKNFKKTMDKKYKKGMGIND